MTRKSKAFTFIDLFAGIGGFHHALEALGGKCVMACELDESCRQVYKTSFPDLAEGSFPSNIRSLTQDAEGNNFTTAKIKKLVPDHDVLCAGFPCQPFSKAGHQLGFHDQTRGTLFYDIMEIVRAKKPKYMILENVRNLAGPNHEETWALIIKSIRESGYKVCDQPVVLSPHVVPKELGGAPQVRERVFILCEYVTLKGNDSNRSSRPLIDTKKYESIWNPDNWRIAPFLKSDYKIKNVQQYRLKEDELMWIDAWEYFVKNMPTDDLPGFPIWVDCFVKDPVIEDGMPLWKREFIEKNSTFYLEHKSFIDKWMEMRWGSKKNTILEFPESRRRMEWQARKHHPTQKGRTLRDLVLQIRQSGLRFKPPTYLPALVAVTQTSIVGPEVKVRGIKEFRRITPEEASALQGIPSDFQIKAGVPDKEAYKQLGNGVNVGVVKLVAKKLFESGEYIEPFWEKEDDAIYDALDLKQNGPNLLNQLTDLQTV